MYDFLNFPQTLFLLWINVFLIIILFRITRQSFIPTQNNDGSCCFMYLFIFSNLDSMEDDDVTNVIVGAPGGGVGGFEGTCTACMCSSSVAVVSTYKSTQSHNQNTTVYVLPFKHMSINCSLSSSHFN